jgi:CobW/HypB/UreG, nucleotide-binding domain
VTELPRPRLAQPSASRRHARTRCAPELVSSAVDDLILVTVVTGFLGAGKTTMLNYPPEQPDFTDHYVDNTGARSLRPPPMFRSSDTGPAGGGLTDAPQLTR